jgi:prepilin-type N-terminal cleavage/methylation domain-containing protein
MFKHHSNNKSGFTLIELLVVIAIIGIISSVMLVSINKARSKARDARRKSDLNQIVKALEIYFNTNNTYIVAGSGYTNPSTGVACGCGWFNYENTGANYIKSVARGLDEASLLSKSLRDPSITYDNQTPQYMIYMCGNGTAGFFVYAKLENPSAADLTSINNAITLCGNAQTRDTYGMNYAVGHN